MISSSKIKSVDFYRKIPRDLTEASLSVIAAIAMIFLFGMELNDYLTLSTTKSIAVDNSYDGDFYALISTSVDEETVEGALPLNGINFEKLSHQYPIFVVNFYAPWCYWSTRLKPSWEKTAKIMKERYDPETDGRILLAEVDCTEEVDLCGR
ncbi:Thioredoxin domain-containing protein, putative isoform 2 [Hibiscus syriacus]|uniref:Thioredoxin domain-containing protein, putative isoform 2 n=1 Tax=Hibiscus syriacus TaxID=106335 RepID=A0A6A3CVH7_HIBSY|nr:Thioredoxin domain-containing protein, putative isoform 2 [Hibiscus syriacus]